MKYLAILLMSLLLSNISFADCAVSSKIALDFLNEYTKYSADVFGNETAGETEHWIVGNARLTPNFKKKYKKMVEDARKSDPELGLDFDPITDAQDFPAQGFEILDCDDRTNFVTLTGKNSDKFRVVVKVIRHNQFWLVDGAGAINIPDKLRIH